MDYPTAREAKKDLHVFRKRFERAWGAFGMFWKIEPQKRGAPHFHLLVRFVGQIELKALRIWMSENWYEVVGSGDVKHLLAGTRVEQVNSWNGVMVYAAKYMGKECYAEAGGWNLPGRWWGVWNEDKWPVTIRTEELPEHTLVLIRRACVAWYEHQPRVFRGEKGPLLDVVAISERGRIRRGLMAPAFIEEMRSCGHTVMVRCQEWHGHSSAGFSERSPAGFWRRVYLPLGCSMFIPAGVCTRIVEWAKREASAAVAPPWDPPVVGGRSGA
jgi:hypothetical protein